MSRRTEQVASTLRRAVQERIIRGLHDPRVRGLISVTDVIVSQDLREATVRVSVLPEEHAELTMHGLHAAAKHLRHEIAEKIALARTPKLLFKLDQSLKAQAGVLHAVNREAETLHADNPENTDGSNNTDADNEHGADNDAQSQENDT